MNEDPPGSFEELSPALAIEAVEEAFGLRLDGTLSVFSSYVNRVYGLRSDEGEGFVVKFYRPGRWSSEAILEEHGFIAECAKAEIPVVPPLPDLGGCTLASLELETDSGSSLWNFALFPKRGGRSFDAEGDEDWRRLGSIAGRIHAVGAKRPFSHRLRMNSTLAASWVSLLAPLVNKEFRADFAEIVEGTLGRISPRLDDFAQQRIHGDLHRGNILDRPGDGLLVIDLDDAMMGPPVHDLWLLLPGRLEECRRELSLLLEGYSDFAALEEGSVAFIEALRFFRMLHFLAWRSRQRDDAWFKRDFPDWGSRAFWIAEIEDLREHARWIP